MLTKEQYIFYNKYREILTLFVNTGQYVGGAGGLFDFIENQYGVKIDRGCSGCIAGFLKMAYKDLIKYEEDGST
jgi:hypothetical protein